MPLVLTGACYSARMKRLLLMAALALCLGFSLVPSAAAWLWQGNPEAEQAQRAASSWPDDEQEVEGLGANKAYFRMFCLNARDEIKAMVNSEDAGRVFKLMHDYFEQNQKIYDLGYSEADRLRPTEAKTGTYDRHAVASGNCKKQMGKVYLNLLIQLVGEGLQPATYSVCDEQKMLPLYRELERRLEDSIESFSLPADLTTLSLYNLGCKTAQHLNQALRGCRWFRHMNQLELAFPTQPSQKPPNKDYTEYQSTAFAVETLLPRS